MCTYVPHVREDGDRYKVFNLVISLWWMSRDRFFSVNLPLPATQVHIKAHSSCITADRTSKRNALFSSSHSSHFHFLIFDPSFFCASFISLALSFCLSPFFPSASCIFPHATPCCSRVYPVSRTHGEMYVQKPHIKININTCVTTSYMIHDNVI